LRLAALCHTSLPLPLRHGRKRFFRKSLEQEVHIYEHFLKSSTDEIELIIAAILITNPYHCRVAALP